jgi:hypothetical protein
MSVALAALCCAACSGDNQDSTPATTPTPGYTIGGTVSGLSGSGLVLQSNAGDTLTVSANGPFTFATALAAGGSYNVSVFTQPTAPAQTCAVTQGVGTVPNGNVTNVVLTCTDKTTTTDTIGGNAMGVLGTGLTLQDNGGDTLSVASNGAFTFATALPGGSPYSVTVLSPPLNPYQDCTVNNGNGTTGSTDVTNVVVSCKTNTNTAFPVAGTITWQSGDGHLILEDNGRDDIAITSKGTAAVPFAFSIPIPTGSPYNVTAKSVDGSQSFTCDFTNASGVVAAAAVNVTIVCTANPTGTLSVSVSNLTGSGLVLQDSAGDTFPIGGNGTETFPTSLFIGTPYTLSVATQPSNPTQVCSAINATGIATALISLAVNCVTTTFAVQVTVAGVFGGPTGSATPFLGPVLQDNGGDNLTVTGNGTFQFATPIASGASYGVTEAVPPSLGDCAIANGSGPVTNSNITNITVTCTPLVWEWSSGSATTYAAGVYGTQNTPAPGNTPGARASRPGTWADTSGDLWLFGGAQWNTTTASNDFLNDLWEFNTNTGLWDWVAGSNTVNAPGVTNSESFTGNVPGARAQGVTWIDASGTLWLFGGTGFDATGTSGYLSDLWQYIPAVPGSVAEWIWVAGSDLANQPGVYNAVVTPVPPTVQPGGRAGAVSWLDGAGNFWLYGGMGEDGQGAVGYLNDLWEYTPDDGPGTWTWVSGSRTAGTSGTYGTQGVAAAGNTPGGRSAAVSWTDPQGNFWLFGGIGLDSTGAVNSLNDLWEFNPTTQQWAWMSGSSTGNAAGVYGVQGTPSAANVPGARQGASAWVAFSSTGTFLGLGLFGGAASNPAGDLNDVWEYIPGLTGGPGQWVWVAGSNTVNSPGTYGTVATPSSNDIPGARQGAASWLDSNNIVWFLGGSGFGTTGSSGYLNDFWGELAFESERSE